MAVSHLPYFLMTSTTTCALLTKRCSAHLHTLRFLLPTKSTSTWESLKPSSSVPQVPKFITRIIFHIQKKYVTHLTLLFCLFCSHEIQNTVEHFAIQVFHSLRTSIQWERNYYLASTYCGPVSLKLLHTFPGIITRETF